MMNDHQRDLLIVLENVLARIKHHELLASMELGKASASLTDDGGVELRLSLTHDGSSKLDRDAEAALGRLLG